MSDDLDFQSVHDSITSALVSMTRSTTQVCAEDVAFYRSLDRSVASTVDQQQATLLSLAERLLRNATAGTDTESPRLPDIEALDQAWRGVVDVLDGLLERADTCLDEFGGLVRKGERDEQQSGRNTGIPPTPVTTGKPGKVPRNLDIPKPQKLFELVPKNDEKGPFKPLLTYKPHAIIPLDQSLQLGVENTQTNEPDYIHPYAVEIEQYLYPSTVYSNTGPIQYHPFDSTKATYVDTEEALAEMLAELKQAKEIAVDLEHHDYRTYIGLVSLMQISTRNRDWIIDTLKPWRRRLECLNEVFTDPKILKVFHGATSDIVWLQRDLGVYVVGLFDTYHAARALRYQGASLAFLLMKFCSFEAQKQYQMADWRIRPIPQIMLDYARSDTHFLLYIYDCMRNELISSSTSDEDLIDVVLTKSKETALQRYEYPIYDSVRGMGPVGWYRLISRTPAIFNREQFTVFRAVHAWRDDIARKEDESTVFVMSNHSLFAVARELPGDRSALFRIAAPVSQPVRLRVDELVGIVTRARAQAETERDMKDVMAEIEKLIISKRGERYAAKDTPAPKTNMTQNGGPVQAVAAGDDDVATNKLSSIIPTPSRPAQPLKSSRFWGAVANTPSTKYHVHHAIRLTLPLPDLTAEIYASVETVQPDDDDDDQEAKRRQEHDFVPADLRVANDGEDDVFVVRQLGGAKRKRGDDRPELAELGALDDDEDITRRKQRNKERKKERQRLRREQDAQDAGLNGLELENEEDEDGLDEEVEEDAFDYGAAPSMITLAQDDGRQKKTKGKKGAFDIYARAIDAPRGLGRSQKGKPGKSTMFKR